MKRHLLPLYLLLAFASSPAAAQSPPRAFPPPAPGITVLSDVEYGRSGTTPLAMDVFKPPSGARGPALVFFNRAVGAHRKGDFYASWARTAASNGLVGIVRDIRSGSEADDLKLLRSHLEQKGSEYGIGGIALYAASGNVSAA